MNNLFDRAFGAILFTLHSSFLNVFLQISIAKNRFGVSGVWLIGVL